MDLDLGTYAFDESFLLPCFAWVVAIGSLSQRNTRATSTNSSTTGTDCTSSMAHSATGTTIIRVRSTWWNSAHSTGAEKGKNKRRNKTRHHTGAYCKLMRAFQAVEVNREKGNVDEEMDIARPEVFIYTSG